MKDAGSPVFISGTHVIEDLICDDLRTLPTTLVGTLVLEVYWRLYPVQYTLSWR